MNQPRLAGDGDRDILEGLCYAEDTVMKVPVVVADMASATLNLQ